jgi:hypothetical protein
VASNEFRFGASSSVFMLGAPGFVFTVENFHPLSASLPDAQCHSFSSSRSAGACHQSAFPLLHSRFGQRCLVPSFQQFVHPVTRDKTWFFLGVIVLLDLLCVSCRLLACGLVESFAVFDFQQFPLGPLVTAAIFSIDLIFVGCCDYRYCS